MFQEIKRTKPYSKMVKSQGAPAQATLLYRPLLWWSTLADALSRSKNNGSVNWGVACSAVTYVLATLVVTPLTSAFFTT